MRLFRSTRSKLIAVGLVAGTVLIPAAVLAGWGPTRPTYTWAHPADHITFNSITDNPVVGDERPFLAGKVTGASGNVVDPIAVHDNDEVQLRVYFHNNAAANLNLVAHNTRVRVFLPTGAASAHTFATSFISADNATPKLVSDTVDFNGAQPFTLAYEPGSAQLWNNVFNGAQLSDSIVTSSGALVGFNSINGDVPGCGQFSGYVTIKVRVHMQTTPTPKPTPQFSCDLLNVTSDLNRKVTASVNVTATNGATLNTVEFNWGDGSTPLTTNSTTATYQYAGDGSFTISATPSFKLPDGSIVKPNTVPACQKTIVFHTDVVPPVVVTTTTPGKPTALPNTGPGDVIGLFTGVSATAAGAHYLVSNRRFRR